MRKYESSIRNSKSKSNKLEHVLRSFHQSRERELGSLQNEIASLKEKLKLHEAKSTLHLEKSAGKTRTRNLSKIHNLERTSEASSTKKSMGAGATTSRAAKSAARKPLQRRDCSLERLTGGEDAVKVYSEEVVRLCNRVEELEAKLAGSESNRKDLLILHNESLIEMNIMEEKSRKTIQALQSKLAETESASNKLEIEHNKIVMHLNERLTKLTDQMSQSETKHIIAIDALGKSRAEDAEKYRRDKAQSDEIIRKMKEYIKNLTGRFSSLETDKHSIKTLYIKTLEDFNKQKLEYNSERVRLQHTIEKLEARAQEYAVQAEAGNTASHKEDREAVLQLEEAARERDEYKQKYLTKLEELSKVKGKAEKLMEDYTKFIKRKNQQGALTVQKLQSKLIAQIEHLSTKLLEANAELERLKSDNRILVEKNGALKLCCLQLSEDVSEELSKETFESEQVEKAGSVATGRADEMLAGNCSVLCKEKSAHEVQLSKDDCMVLDEIGSSRSLQEESMG